MKTPLFLSCLAVLLSGCHARGPVASSGNVYAAEKIRFDPAGVRVMQPVAGQRFTPTTSVLVSYDTQTGRICRTYGWGGSVMETGIEPCEWMPDKAPPKAAK